MLEVSSLSRMISWSGGTAKWRTISTCQISLARTGDRVTTEQNRSAVYLFKAPVGVTLINTPRLVSDKLILYNCATPFLVELLKICLIRALLVHVIWIARIARHECRRKSSYKLCCKVFCEAEKARPLKAS